MESKKVNDSRVVMAQLMNPLDANPMGNVHGGVIMRLIDTAAGAAAMRHARKLAVTASIDRMDFHHPIFVGDLVTLKASVNLAGHTSMEVGVRVEAENLVTGEVRHTNSAYLTYVALDSRYRPAAVPALILENEEDHRRNQQARARRELRLQERKTEAVERRDG